MRRRVWLASPAISASLQSGWGLFREVGWGWGRDREASLFLWLWPLLLLLLLLLVLLLVLLLMRELPRGSSMFGGAVGSLSWSDSAQRGYWYLHLRWLREDEVMGGVDAHHSGWSQLALQPEQPSAAR